MKLNTIITAILLCTSPIIQSSERPAIFSTIEVFSVKRDSIATRLAKPDDLDQLSDLSQKNYQTNFKPLWKKHYATMTPAHHTIESFVQEKADRNDASNKEVTCNQTNNPDSTQKLLVAELTETRRTVVLSNEIKTTSTNKTIGYCRFEKQDAHTMYINFILVAEEYRKRGVAKQLAQAAMSHFDGITECKFRALVHYDFINDLYTKHDCQQIGTVSLDPITGQVSTDLNAPITHIDYSYTIKK